MRVLHFHAIYPKAVPLNEILCFTASENTTTKANEVPMPTDPEILNCMLDIYVTKNVIEGINAALFWLSKTKFCFRESKLELVFETA